MVHGRTDTMTVLRSNPYRERQMKRRQVRFVKTIKGLIRTWDNPLNTWVRSLDDGQFYRTI